MDIRDAVAEWFAEYQATQESNEGNRASTASLGGYTVSERAVGNQLGNTETLDASQLQDKKISLREVSQASMKLVEYLKHMSSSYKSNSHQQYRYYQKLCIKNLDKAIKEIGAYHKHDNSKSIFPNLFFYYLDEIEREKFIDKNIIMFLVKYIGNTDILSKNHTNLIMKNIYDTLANKKVITIEDNTKPNFRISESAELRSFVAIFLSKTPQETYYQYKLAQDGIGTLYKNLQWAILSLFNDSIADFKTETEALAKNNELTEHDKEDIFELELSNYISNIERDNDSIEKKICLLDFLKNSPICVPISCLLSLVNNIKKIRLNSVDTRFFAKIIEAAAKKTSISANTKKADIEALLSIMLALPYIKLESFNIKLPFKNEYNCEIFLQEPSALLVMQHSVNKKIFQQKNIVKKHVSEEKVNSAISQLSSLLDEVDISGTLRNKFFKRTNQTKNLDYRLTTKVRQHGSGLAAERTLRDYFVHMINLITELYHTGKLDKEACITYFTEIAEALPSCTDGVVDAIKGINYCLHTVDCNKEVLSIIMIVKEWLGAYILDMIEEQIKSYRDLISINRIPGNQVHDINRYTTALKQACKLPVEQGYYEKDKFAREPKDDEYGTVPERVAEELDARFCSVFCIEYIAEKFNDETARDAYIAYFRRPQHIEMLRTNFPELPDVVGVHELYEVLFPDSLKATSLPWKPDMFCWIYFLKRAQILIRDFV